MAISSLFDQSQTFADRNPALDAGYTYKPVVLNGVSYMPSDREAYKAAYQNQYGTDVPVPNPWYDAAQNQTDSLGRAKSLLDPQANQPTGSNLVPRQFGELNYGDKELWSPDLGFMDFLKGWLAVPATGMILGMGAMALTGGGLLKSLTNFAQDPSGAIQSVISSGGEGLTQAQLAQMAQEAQQLGLTQQAAELASLGGGAAGAVIPGLGAASTGGLTNGINLLGTSGASALNTASGGLLSSTGAMGGAATSALGTLAAGLGIPTAGASSGGLLTSVASALGMNPTTLQGLISGGSTLLGGILQGNSSTDAMQQQSKALQQIADQSKFKPIGITNTFGTSNFGYDAKGNLSSAGYTLSPEMKAQQGKALGLSGQALDQYVNSINATAPIGQAAQSMFNLGGQYLGTSPEAQAAKYYQDQQNLLSPSRERDLASLMNTLQNQGRMGLSTGGTSTLGPSNPEMEAFYNAQRMQDLNLAANATQGGMDYAKFGAGMSGLGATALQDMYKTQTAAADPWTTALGGANTIEKMGQVPFDLSTALGAKVSTANTNAGQFAQQAANVAAPANAYNPWADALSSVGGMLTNYKWS